MQYLNFSFVLLASVGLIFLGACSNNNQTASTDKNSISISPTASASPAAKTNNEHGASKGGQVVETGAYHLEFVPEKDANGTHMDLYLLRGDNHETVPNAKVTAQVQLPDGTQKNVPFTYDAKDKHYTGLLSEKATGQYQVKVTADVGGKKIDGRFSFNK
ncbi:MAG: hypothetical protein IGS49_27275 [Chlorogloeopsis fritschii C42_A2020_084]|uniref:hypothetical protein n=1 Tax=Chlorogloeopsis fritschii TaxID=1124 RepID=UPI001A01A985|nr:hypothetical protein [Chlorogloeopsis fritschii]MBF2009049.1 hypothetical protein [Chlorogloeopsis fritschii C42_A2020_084]